MLVYFLRHASAGSHMVNPKKDEKRALDSDGIDQCRTIGRALVALDVQVETIISSPLKRATQTASLVGNEIGYEGKLILDPALRPEADFGAFRELLERNSRSDSIMVVGHNPSLSQFLGRTISDNGSEASVDLKKGAVARVEWSRNSGVLNWCLTPKLVRSIYASATDSSRPKTSRK